MNTKIVTLLEKHVEKIVLAVAVAGAGFIAWSGIQPTAMPSDPTMTASTVEDHVTKAVNDLEAARKQTQEIPDARLQSAVHNYVGDYTNIMLHHPLSENLVAGNIPRFAPLQESLGGTGSGGSGGGDVTSATKIASAVVPAPKNVQVTADRGAVLPPPTDPSQPQPAPGQPGAAQPVDKNWVCVSGDIPWGDYVNYFKNLPTDQKLPDEQQHNVLYKVEVQRRARTATGWTDWQPVPATTAAGPAIPDIDWDSLNDTDWISTVSQLDASFQRIAEPLFYYLAPHDPTTQPPTPILAPNAKPPATPGTAGTSGAPGAAPGGAPGGTGTVQPRPGVAARPGALPPGARMDQEGNIIPAGRPMTAAPVNPDDSGNSPMQPVPGVALDVNQLKQSGTVPFWFWDETVQAGQEYQYRARLVMYNPLYRYPQPQRLVDPKSATQGSVASTWVVVSTPVAIQGDTAFFVDNPFGSSSNVTKVQFSIFKWTNGMWCRTSGGATVDLAGHVAGQVHSPDANHPFTSQVDTGYTLVDAQMEKGGDLTATLLSPTGELITRNSMADSNDPEHKKLNDQTKPIGKPVAPKPPPVVPNRAVNPRGNPENNPDNQ